MMKKRNLLCFILCANMLTHLKAQTTVPIGTYKIESKLTLWVTHTENSAGCPNNTIHVYYLIDGAKQEIFNKDGANELPNAGDVKTYHSSMYIPAPWSLHGISKINTISDMQQRASVIDGGGCPGIHLERNNITYTPLCSSFYDGILASGSVSTWGSNLTIVRTPQLTIVDSGNNFFEVDDPNGIDIVSHSGFEVGEYNWEFCFPSKDQSVPKVWFSLKDYDSRKFSGKSNINLTIADIKISDPNVPSNPKQYYGKILDIRQKGCVNSKPVSYTMVKTPPLLVSTTPPEKTKCSYSTDGKIQFTFNRPLETSAVDPLLNETFFFNLKWYDPIGLTYKDVVNSFDVVNTPTNSQCTLKNLPPGKYQATYQTKFPNDVVTNPPTTLNSKDKPINDFEIVAPTPLKYTARMAQPKCATDGAEIVVNATGGTPPYSYSINGLPAVKYIDTDEKGLQKGDYIIKLNNNIPNKTKITIKVTDKQGCVDGDTEAPK
jgi:hypothetical protein